MLCYVMLYYIINYIYIDIIGTIAPVFTHLKCLVHWLCTDQIRITFWHSSMAILNPPCIIAVFPAINYSNYTINLHLHRDFPTFFSWPWRVNHGLFSWFFHVFPRSWTWKTGNLLEIDTICGVAPSMEVSSWRVRSSSLMNGLRGGFVVWILASFMRRLWTSLEFTHYMTFGIWVDLVWFSETSKFLNVHSSV